MSHPRFISLAVPALAAAALLFAGSPADAGGKGGGGGAHGGVSHGGAVHAGAVHGGAVHVGAVHGGAVHGGAVHGGVYHGGYYHNGGYYNHNHNHGYGYGLGVGVYLGGGGYPYYGGGYDYGYPVYADDYYTPSYSAPVLPSYNVTPPVGGDTPSDLQPTPRRSQEPIAHVRVIVPADAEVWFGTGKTVQTGTTREFVSPALSPGKAYTYDIKARWMQGDKEVVQTRQIDVSAGSWTSVDFTKPAAESLPAPNPKE